MVQEPLPEFSIGQEVLIGSPALCIHGKVIELRADSLIVNIGIRGADMPLFFREYGKAWKIKPKGAKK